MRNQINLLLIVLFVLTSASGSVNASEFKLSAHTVHNSPVQSTVTRILVDKSLADGAGQIWIPDGFSQVAAYLRNFNYAMETNINRTVVYDADSLDPATQLDLKGYDILILAFPKENLASAYIDDILAFVNDGGGLLLGGVAPSKQMWYQSPLCLNPLSQTFGVEFNYYPIGGVSRVIPRSRDGTITGELISHPIWDGVSSINFEGCTLNITGTLANATSIYNATEPIGNTTAVATYGAGRVFFTGSYHQPLGTIYDGATINPTTDHSQFILNVMNWLTDHPHQAAERNYPYKIYLRDGPELPQDELDDYNLYVGSMHMHVSKARGGHDDGVVDPDDRIDQAELVDLDFIIMSSHAYGINQASDWATLEAGGFYMREKAKREGYHVVCHVGAEVSGAWAHMFSFPYTEVDEGKMPRIDTLEQFAEDIEAVRERHDLFVGWAHPELMYNDIATPSAIFGNISNGNLKVDAIELTNWAIAGSLQYTFPFYGPSDAHYYDAINRTLTYVFAKSRSEADLIDAFRGRRTVVLNRFGNTIYNNDPYQVLGNYVGDRVWVDELFQRIEESRTSLNTVEAEIDAKAAEGEDMAEATARLSLAWRAFNQLSPSKAQNLANKVFAKDSEDSPAWSVWILLLSFHFLVWIHVRRTRKRRI
ncbi:MAG: hypothetical protein ACFFGZ_02555 [Candidatus Thorarchaeota archaeon]